MEMENVASPTDALLLTLPHRPRSRNTGLLAAVEALLVLLALGLFLAPDIAAIGLAALGCGVPLVWWVWARPEYGLLAIVFLASSFVPSDVVDLRLPIGGLELRDLVLLGMLGMLIVRGLVGKRLRLDWWPVSMPLLIFLSMAVFSAVYALIYRGVESNWVFAELRALVYYATFFATTWSLAGRRRLRQVVDGLFVLADMTSTLLILQQFAGVSSRLLSTMSGSNWTVFQQSSASGSFGTVRIVPPGHVLMNCMMVVAFCFVVLPVDRRLRLTSAFQFVYLNVGLLLTYTRAQWIAAGIALGLIVIVTYVRHRARARRWLVVGLAAFMLAYAIIGPAVQERLEEVPFVTALSERFVSLLTPGKTLDSYSLQWRIFEMEKARQALSAEPVLGVGLGNAYRDITLLHGEASGKWYEGLAAGQASRFTRFIHSSYLAIAVKMGVPAVACFLWFIVAFLRNSARLWLTLQSPYEQGLVLGVGTSLIGLVAWAVFHQLLVQTESTATIGVLLGLVAAVAAAAEHSRPYLDVSGQRRTARRPAE